MNNNEYATIKTQTLVSIALYAAIVATVTMFTSIQYTQGGYFNLGDVAVMLLGALIPFRHALIAVSVGSMLADGFVGAIYYMVFTGIIKGLMVVVIHLLRKMLDTKLFFVPFLLGSLLMVILYGVVDAFLLGGYTFYASVSTNLAQGILGFVITTVAYPFSIKLRDYLKE